MGIRVAINGFGRIGRLVFRAGLHHPELEFVAVNDLTDAKTLGHLLQYDSTFGAFPEPVVVDGDTLVVGGKRVKVVAERDPAKLPWKAMNVDLVVESTGFFTSADKAKAHLDAGAKRVVISAPAKGEDITICMGINEDKYDPSKHRILSNASCTTNCLAPMAKVLHEQFGIKRGLMTTIHSYTGDQRVLDAPHSDLRRARAAAVSMIPTTTGAAKAISLVLPELKGKLHGMAVRVPTPDVSVVDLVAELGKPATKDEINKAFHAAAASGPLKGRLSVSDVPLVSNDFKGDPSSCVLDSELTEVLDGTLVKVFGWYDNEWGYSNRVVDLAAYIAKKEAALAKA